MSTPIFINELHYDNVGIDFWEGVEVAGPAGTSLDGWKIVLYSGTDGQTYQEKEINGLIPDLQNGFGTLFFAIKGIRNGGKQGDGICLVDKKWKARQFLSYEGQFAAKNGPAQGMQSQLIPAKENGWTFPGFSLQLEGEGSVYEDFKWAKDPVIKTYGSINHNQKFVKPTNVNEPLSLAVDTQTELNRQNHHTHKYHTKEMVVLRRGQTFDITLIANSGAVESAKTTFQLENYPERDVIANITIQDSPVTSLSYWAASASHTEGSKITVSITIPVTASVGQYLLTVKSGTESVLVSDPIIILFNPWCKEDTVYMPQEDLLGEYILNDEGFIWVGSSRNNGPKAWNFAQFNTKSLLASLELLLQLPYKQRNDPVLVSRKMSAMCNSSDDNGVLTGNWSGDYDGGSKPGDWTGSAEILKQHLLTKRPVKYGQCWVFSGVLTSVCRSLGIPARSVTNFDSAHDTGHFNRAVDKYLTKDGDEDKSKTDDSIWNFHVWNDVWMSRPDLNTEKYSGWQAVDATPQELSGGKYQTGPTPLAAIKDGDVGIHYDLEFLYSEVNADIKYHMEKDDGSYEVVRTIKDGVGRQISTKRPLKSQLEVVTDQYKYKEGSLEERAAHFSSTTPDPKEDTVRFELKVHQGITVGNPLVGVLHLQKNENASDEPVEVDIKLALSAATYSGRVVKNLLHSSHRVTVHKGKTTELSLTAEFKQYSSVLKEDVTFFFRAFGIVHSAADETALVTHAFIFPDEDVKISLASPLSVGADGKLDISFTNPLSISLNNVVLFVEGQGLTKVQKIAVGKVGAKETVNQSVDVHGWEKGEHYVIALVDSTELVGRIKGHLAVTVE